MGNMDELVAAFALPFFGCMTDRHIWLVSLTRRNCIWWTVGQMHVIDPQWHIIPILVSCCHFSEARPDVLSLCAVWWSSLHLVEKQFYNTYLNNIISIACGLWLIMMWRSDKAWVWLNLGGCRTNLSWSISPWDCCSLFKYDIVWRGVMLTPVVFLVMYGVYDNVHILAFSATSKFADLVIQSLTVSMDFGA